MSSSTRPSATIAVGGKGSYLSSAAVYAVSCGLAAVSIDSAALEKLSRSKKSPPHLKDDEGYSNLRLSTPEESRAALAFLLNKLVLSDAGIRPAIPVLIAETLALTSGVETLDLGSALGLLNSLGRLHSKTIDEIGANREEIGIFEGSCAASIGICAMIDCCSSSLVKVSDAVTALSCEAARASVEVFDSFGAGDGFSVKDENDVAADMKALLFGSKLVGQNSFAPFNEIPTISGSYRGAVKSLHNRIKVELNSILEVKKT